MLLPTYSSILISEFSGTILTADSNKFLEEKFPIRHLFRRSGVCRYDTHAAM